MAKNQMTADDDGSQFRVTLNASCLSLAQSASTSVHVGTGSRRRTTAGSVRVDSRSGMRSPASRWLHHQHANNENLSLITW